MCLYPKLINNKRYTKTKKNGGNIPPVTDPRVKKVPVGCGRCIECTKQRARGWQVRLLEDVRHNKNGKFITLTFSNEHITKLKQIVDTYADLEGYPLDNEIATIAVRFFLERWRKQYKKSLRHWFVTELGHEGTENIHIHGIVWTDEDLQILENIWKYGFVWKGREKNGKLINYVNEETVNYITKYVSKQDLQHKCYNPKVLTSPGIGAGYTTRPDSRNNKFNGKDTIETYRTRTGHKIAMPIYWRNKIYSENEREQLWLHKLDKNERWVCGNKIDISKSEIKYYNILKWYRQRNKELGYGSDEISWSQEMYETQRRALMLARRTATEQVTVTT